MTGCEQFLVTSSFNNICGQDIITLFIVIVIVISKLLKRHWKAKHRALAYSHRLATTADFSEDSPLYVKNLSYYLPNLADSGNLAYFQLQTVSVDHLYVLAIRV